MKMFYGSVAALLCLICVVSAYPASTASDEVELIAPTPAIRPVHRPSVVILPGVQLADGDVFNVQSILTPSTFDNSDELPGLNLGFFKRIQDLFSPSLFGLGSFTPSIDTDTTDTDTVVGSEVDTKTDDDGATTKTTSTIKIIDGRKYRINETITTRNLGNFGQSVFRTRTVELVADDDADTASEQPNTTLAPANEDVSTAASSSVAPESASDTKLNRKDVTESTAPVSEADAMEPEAAGSPEVLDPDYRQNEINARNSRNGRVEVVQKS